MLIEGASVKVNGVQYPVDVGPATYAGGMVITRFGGKEWLLLASGLLWRVGDHSGHRLRISWSDFVLPETHVRTNPTSIFIYADTIVEAAKWRIL